jgi:hypothetical protein
MIARGFVQSEVDMCLYYRSISDMIYTDGGIFCAPTEAEIDRGIQCLSQACRGKTMSSAFKMTNEGDLSDG